MKSLASEIPLNLSMALASETRIQSKSGGWHCRHFTQSKPPPNDSTDDRVGGQNMANCNARLRNLPKPPAFLDPLSSVEDCYYYAVPAFFDTSHPLTSWLLKRILSGDTETLRRKLEFSPASLSNKYFQILDDPEVYVVNKSAGSPMFHSKCLLYMTPLGVSLYFKAVEVANLFLSFRTPTNLPVAHPEEPQYASHLQDTTTGDFHAFLPYVVLMRREVFAASTMLQMNGWKPDKPFAMPLRRRYERRVMYYRDWLDAALGLFSIRPVYPLAALVGSIVSYPYYSFSRLPMAAVKPPPQAPTKGGKKKAGATPTVSAKKGKRKKGDLGTDPTIYTKHGIMPVGDQPLVIRLVGTHNMMELCEAYDRLRQSRLQARLVRDLLREASARGLNTEILRIQAEDCIAEDSKIQEQNDNNPNNDAEHYWDDEELKPRGRRSLPDRQIMWRLNSNNHAKKAKKVVPTPGEQEHCSEPLRILLFSLYRDKSGASLGQCLEAVSAYVKWNYFACAQPLRPDHGRSRDVRNVVVCLMNLIWREQSIIERIVERVRAGSTRWRALETIKQNHTALIGKVSTVMTAVLMNSKQIVAFLSNKRFPPYPASTVDFRVDPHLSQSMMAIRYGVVRDLNACKDSWKYLTPDMLAEVVKDSAVLLHFRVGKRPSKATMEELRGRLDNAAKSKSKKKKK